MKTSTLRAWLFGCAMGVSAGVAGVALAQTGAAAGAGAPDPAQPPVSQPPASPPTSQGGDAANAVAEVIVTANRRAEPLSRVGIPVAVVGAQQLKDQEIHSPTDLARVVPGFQAETAGLTGAPVFILRGVGFDSPNPSSTAPVGTYVDEVAYAYPYMSLGVNFDLQRVEVLKGPQGTLYGRNTTGGFVDFIPAKPTDHFEAGQSLSYGNYNSVIADGYVSGPLTDTLKGRLAYESDDRFSGWQESVTRGERLGTHYRNSVRGTLDWTPTDRLSVDVTGTYWHLGGDTQAAQAIAYVGAPALENPLTAQSIIANPTSNTQADFAPASHQPQADIGVIRPQPQNDTSFYAGAVKVNYKLNDHLTAASLTSYNYLGYFAVADTNGSQIESQSAVSTGHIGSFSQELRLLGDYDRLNWSAGFYYAKDVTNESDYGYVDELSTIVGLRGAAIGLDGLLGNPVPPASLARSFGNYGSIGTYHDQVVAGFANVQYHFNDQFNVSLGGRYTDDDIKGSGCGRDYNGNNVALVNFLYPFLTENPALPKISPGGCYTLTPNNSGFELVQSEQDKGTFSWRARGEYTPNGSTLFYLSISRGYKSGTFPVLAASSATQLLPVSDEELMAYEGGAKLRLLQGRLQFNSSVYYYDYTNRQIFGREPDLIFGTLQRIVNVPKSETYGIDLDANFRVTPELTATAALSYLHAEVDEFTGYNNQLVAALVDYKGARLPYSPEFQGNFALTYEHPLNDRLLLFAATNVSYQSRSSSVLGSEAGYQIDSYALLGGKVGIHTRDGKWQVDLFGQNLTDEYYWTSAQRQSETLVRYTGQPRTYGVRVTYAFR